MWLVRAYEAPVMLSVFAVYAREVNSEADRNKSARFSRRLAVDPLKSEYSQLGF